MSAKSEAIKKLGREDDYINLKGLNTERTNAQNRYNTDYTNLQNKYNELVAQADRNKLAAKSDFNTNRLEIDRDAYMNTRGLTGADLSDRGLSEGFGAGGKFSSMLQRNNASSDVANTYYNAMADIKRKMDTDTQDYNYNINNLKLDLDKQLAEIGAREAAARNAYRAQVAQLAEQIQARWDSNANAKASLNAMKEQYNKENNASLIPLYTPKDKTSSDEILSIARQIVSDGKVEIATKDAKGNVTYRPVNNVSEALNWLNSNGLYRQSEVNAATKKRVNTELANAYNKPKSLKDLLFGTEYYYSVDEDGNLVKGKIMHN